MHVWWFGVGCCCFIRFRKNFFVPLRVFRFWQAKSAGKSWCLMITVCSYFFSSFAWFGHDPFDSTSLGYIFHGLHRQCSLRFSFFSQPKMLLFANIEFPDIFFFCEKLETNSQFIKNPISSNLLSLSITRMVSIFLMVFQVRNTFIIDVYFL